MTQHRSILLALAGFAAVVAMRPAALPAQQRRAISWSDFAAVRGVADPQLAPDGRTVLYTVRVADVEANRRIPTTYSIGVAGGARRIWPNDSAHVAEARWSPDGSRVAYVAGGQLWIANADGSASRRLTALHGGVSGPVWAPSGDRIAFVSAAYPDCADDACNASRDKAKEESKVKARVVDKLMYRHWNAWDEGTRSHLFVVAPDGRDLRDLTVARATTSRRGPFGGSEGYASPRREEVAYTAKDAGRQEAWSTDINVYVVPVSGGTPRSSPRPTAPPTRTRSIRRTELHRLRVAGARRVRVGSLADDVVRSCGQGRRGCCCPTWDRNAESYFFAPDGEVAVHRNGRPWTRPALSRPPRCARHAIGAPSVEIERNNNTAFSVSRDGRVVAWLRDAIDRPAEVWVRETTRGTQGKPTKRPAADDGERCARESAGDAPR